MIGWNKNNIIEEMVLAAGGLCDVPFRLKELEKQFIGRDVNNLQLNEIIPENLSMKHLMIHLCRPVQEQYNCEAIKLLLLNLFVAYTKRVKAMDSTSCKVKFKLNDKNVDGKLILELLCLSLFAITKT